MDRGAFGTWVGFAAVSTAGALAAAALGLLLGNRGWLVPDGSIPVGCLCSLAGSWAGAIPLAHGLAGRSRPGSATGIPVAEIGKASLYRLLVTLLAAGGAVGLGDWQRRSLLFAVAVSYVLLLAVETGWLMNRLRASHA